MPTLHSHTHCQAPRASSNSKACQRVCLCLPTGRQINNESTTINIGHLADSIKFEMSTINKTYSGLISWSFEMPNAPYSSRWQQFKKYGKIKCF